MAKKKQYADADVYERKLDKVMERFGTTDYTFNWDRFGSWVEFRYKGKLYRFDHSVEKAKAKGLDLRYGSDAFAQVVLALEDLARMVERGIYDLETWIEGMKFLPPVLEVPSFFKYMGYDRIPTDVDEVKARYRSLAKQMHPDTGGRAEDFKQLQTASEQAMKYLNNIM
jgi:hypothetical protein